MGTNKSKQADPNYTVLGVAAYVVNEYVQNSNKCTGM